MNRPILFVGLLCVLFAIYLYSEWNVLNSNQAIFGAVIAVTSSVIGASLGGIVTGYYSYLAGIKGAEKSFDLLRQQQFQDKISKEEQNRKIILGQLKYTYKLLNNPPGAVEFNGLLYDDDWYVRLTECGLDEKEFEIVFNWFKQIKTISIGYGFVDGKFTDIPIPASQRIDGTKVSAQQVVFFFNEYYENIKGIIDKFSIQS